jgi:hypothetical protein
VWTYINEARQHRGVNDFRASGYLGGARGNTHARTVKVAEHAAESYIAPAAAGWGAVADGARPGA